MDYAGRELSIESEKVLDYGLQNSLNLKSLMENFTKTYSNYSDADEIYFIFGNLIADVVPTMLPVALEKSDIHKKLGLEPEKYYGQRWSGL